MKLISNEKPEHLRNLSYKDGFVAGRELRNHELAEELLKIACKIKNIDTWDKQLKEELIDKLLFQYKRLAK